LTFIAKNKTVLNNVLSLLLTDGRRMVQNLAQLDEMGPFFSSAG